MRDELTDDTLAEVKEEFRRAWRKHHGWTPASRHVSDHECLVILTEEVGEVARAMTYDNANDENLHSELIQTATMAAAWAERVRGRLTA